jgi:hypothetical protein
MGKRFLLGAVILVPSLVLAQDSEYQPNYLAQYKTPATIVDVRSAVPVLRFEAQPVPLLKVVPTNGGYWVYLAKGTAYLNVRAPGYILQEKYVSLDYERNKRITLAAARTSGQGSNTGEGISLLTLGDLTGISVVLEESDLEIAQKVTDPIPQVAKPGFARLSIASTPPGASVFIDDDSVNVTPCSVDSLPAGEHELRLWKKGYQSVTQTIQIKADEALALNLPLQKGSGSFKAKSNMEAGGKKSPIPTQGGRTLSPPTGKNDLRSTSVLKSELNEYYTNHPWSIFYLDSTYKEFMSTSAEDLRYFNGTVFLIICDGGGIIPLYLIFAKNSPLHMRVMNTIKVAMIASYFSAGYDRGAEGRRWRDVDARGKRINQQYLGFYIGTTLLIDIISYYHDHSTFKRIRHLETQIGSRGPGDNLEFAERYRVKLTPCWDALSQTGGLRITLQCDSFLKKR